jgi:hypothetical protein
MSKTVPIVATEEKRIEVANGDVDTEAGASQKRKAHLMVGFLEGRIVPGLCAEGLETRSSIGSLEDRASASQEKKHFNIENRILFFIRYLPERPQVLL